MGMDGVMYGYIVRNLRKPKKNFCLSIGLVGCFVWVLNKEGIEYTNPWQVTEVVGTSMSNIADSLFEARRS
jgi:hypothetical protein